MKKIFSLLFFVIAFACQSQNAATHGNDKETGQNILTLGTNDTKLVTENSVNTIESTDNTISPGNKAENVKKEDKKTEDKKTSKKAGKRVQVNPVYIIVGIVVAAVVIYFATSSRTTKM